MALGTFVLAMLSMSLGVAGHGDEGGSLDNPSKTYPPTYFTFDSPKFAIQAHIGLMIVSWFLMLPIATMLSLAKSRYTDLVRLGCIATNAIGVILGIIYKHQAPDLYPGSSHSAVGWIATGTTALQTSHLLAEPIVRLISLVTGHGESKLGAYTPPPMQERFNRLQSRQDSLDVEATHFSRENRDQSPNSPLYQEEESGFASGDETYYEDSDFIRDHDSISTSNPLFSRAFSTRTQKSMSFLYNVMDRTILIVAFVAFCTGIVTFWGLFKGKEVFNGLAHWIKGAIFFWLGIFNLGRWCGCFAELGWAWNSRPGNTERQLWLSSEFVESSLIFIYGSTNIFLEHLSGWGKPWTPRDLEHVAITVLFIGGGLCGMLVEYVRVKGFGKKQKSQQMQSISTASNGVTEEHTDSQSNGISINPLPALVIFLMGGSMASHEQASMVSTMVHKQWGNLLGAASIARLITYIILYMKPPTSTAPSRPPTELLMSFCLISGGILFMASSSDIINGMIHFGVDPMALYTVIMGLTGILMAWIMALLALKGWVAE